MTRRRIALISVSDKTGITDLARTLTKFGIELLSTGGTAKTLQEAGLEVTEIGEYTGFPEMLDGRVKTLHPKVHGGILARRDLETHRQALEEHAIPAIDIVVVNLYPFVQTVTRPDCTLEHAIENIDIGGPTMVRAAAKNWQHVAVITDPSSYPALMQEIESSGGAISQETRFQLARAAFSHTAAYDSAISNYLTATNLDGERKAFPAQANINFVNVQDLRYGENPHQKAAFYRDLVPTGGGIANYAQLQGKELSYNNIADSDAAWECVKTFDQPACVIIKHANPCGVGVDASALGAYKKAFSTDTTSAFGGIIAFNRPIDAEAAQAVSEQFVEVVIAPQIDHGARDIFSAKQNVRVLEVPLTEGANDFDYKRVGGGLLIQSPDVKNVSANELRVVTRKQPDTQQMSDLLFAWRVAKFVKSNAIVFCGNGMTLGVGAGQMSRVDSARIASIKAEKAGLSLTGSVVASDAFFPFRDGVDVVAEAGAKAVIQPGGSVRDEEVIAAADEHAIAMVFTGIRHFRH
ncbi:MAG: bifunctional phosphoribosylaminoimidazolecarboxamide formyltransferase/IMP cyclohydrolase [Betaproteobacteria bacterium]|nr:MAG: bifunctional phosphoribosylaminoimidazolecarboxamide formyltransferase/IMP cyclohydrolase [Betaproteobacteria bacterium]